MTLRAKLKFFLFPACPAGLSSSPLWPHHKPLSSNSPHYRNLTFVYPESTDLSLPQGFFSCQFLLHGSSRSCQPTSGWTTLPQRGLPGSLCRHGHSPHSVACLHRTTLLSFLHSPHLHLKVSPLFICFLVLLSRFAKMEISWKQLSFLFYLPLYPHLEQFLAHSRGSVNKFWINEHIISCNVSYYYSHSPDEQLRLWKAISTYVS